MTRAIISSRKLSRWLLFAVLAALLVTSAAAQDYLTLKKGGGITGNITAFRISPFGQVAKGSGAIEPEFLEFAQLRKGKAKKYFRKTRALLKEQTFNYPGNTYTEIELSEGGHVSRMVWGDVAHDAPAKARKLVRKIQASLNRLTFRKELRK
jgi:hypothetical protein